MKENFGKLSDLKKLETLYNNSFSKEQLFDENLKNTEGESNLEVRKRMVAVIQEIIKNHAGKRIAVVSHGAALKFYLQSFCQFDRQKDSFFFKDEEVCPFQIPSPGVIKLIFQEEELIKAKMIKI